LISRIPVLANGINQIREGFLPFLKSFSNCVLTSLPSISIVLLLGAGGSTPAMSFSTRRISWNLGAADEPTQDNSAETYC
jgi:hypothetical protein